jgi:hypothetical protein
MKVSSVTAELFHADGRTDMTKLTAAFSNFANKPNVRLRTLLLYVHATLCFKILFLSAVRYFTHYSMIQKEWR